MCHQNRLYRDGVFEPVASIREYVEIMPPPQSGRFFQVDFVEPIPFLDSSLSRPGILLRDFNAGNLADGASIDVAPTELQMPLGEMLHFRFTLFETPAGAGYISAQANVDLDRIDVRVSELAANARWRTLNSGGVVNTSNIIPLASSEEAAFGHGAAAVAGTAEAATANVNRLATLPWKQLNLTELFVFQADQPTFTVVNRTGQALTQGQLRLAVGAFRYGLSPVDSPPANYTTIPVQGRGPGSQARN